MTDREIKEARKGLPARTQVPWDQWTEAEQHLDRELSCRDMINSILCYDGADGLENNEYMKQYIEFLGADVVSRLCEEQIEDFKKAIVKKDVYKDGEGVSYNSIIWADERSVDDLVADANQRSFEHNDKSNNLQITILQVKEGEEHAFERFSPLRCFKNGVDAIKFENYDNVYSYCEDIEFDFSYDMACADLLEGVYTAFNLHHPKDFTGHSLGVSDVVVLNNGKDVKAFYCDSIGFEVLPDKFVNDFKKDLESVNELHSPDIEL